MMKKLTRLILPLLACLLLSGVLPALLPNIAGAAEKTYTITQGTAPAYVSNVEIDKTKAAAGEPVTVRILRPSHYSCVVQSCSYADRAGSVTYLLSDADDAPPARDCVITFPMPAKNITVTVGFAERRTVPQEYLANRDSREYLRMDKVYTKPNTKVNLYVTEPYRKELETIRLEKIVNGRYSHWYDIPGVPGTNVYTLTSPDDSDTSVYLELFWKDAPQYSVHANCSPGNGGAVQGTGSYYAGDTVTVTAAPNEAFDLSSVTATTASGSVTVQPRGNGVYTFTMPSMPVTINAGFRPKWVVTYEIIGGTWADGTTDARTEYVSDRKKPGSVPTPGQPSAGYTNPGSWNSVPDDWLISADRTFTYSFTPCHTVTYKIENGFWADGTNTSKTEGVLGGHTPAEIPTGMAPAEGFSKIGRWDTDPADVPVTQDQTFTYSFGELSGYARLGSLTIPGVTLQPAFASNIIEYYASVPYSVQSVELKADTYHVAATVEGGGTRQLAVGWNDFTVTAVAEDKIHRQDYYVHILRLAAPTEIRVLSCPDVVDVNKDFYLRFYVGTDVEYQEVYEPVPTVTVNGTSVGAMEHMDMGYKVTIPASALGIGTHELLISYPGNESFAPCRTACTVTVKEKRQLTVRSLAPSVAHPGKAYTVSGILTDQWGEPAAGVSGTVDIQMNYGGAGYFGSSFTTDETGAFSCAINKNLPAEEGTLALCVRVQEDDDLADLRYYGSVRFSAGEHEWGPWTVTTPPAPGQPGEETRTCLHDPGHTESRQLVLHAVTYRIVNGLWSHENSDTVIEYVLDGDAPSYIPGDMQPDAGYGVGRWDVTPTKEAVTEDRTYTFTYSHYTISFDTGGIGTAPAPRQSAWSGSSASGRPDKDWFSDAAYAEAVCEDDSYTQYWTNDPDKGTVFWFLDPDDEATGVGPWDFVEGDVTLYCKWKRAARLVDAAELTVSAQAGDPIPRNFEKAADFGLAVPDGADYAVTWARWLDEAGEEPGMNFEPGRTYRLRAMLSTGDPDGTVWFKGHNSAKNPDGTIDPAKCFALTVNGQSGAATVDNMDATTAVFEYTYTVPVIPAGQMYFVGHSLTLKDDIGINFIVDLGNADPADAVVEFCWTVELANGTTVEKSETVRLDEAERIPQDKPCAGCCKAPVHVAAKEMTDVVTATLKIKDAAVKKNQYSVQTYARTILADTGHETYSEALWNLARTMLIYGAKSQLLFQYRTWFPADEGMDYTLTAPTGLRKNTLPDSFGDFGLTFLGSTLLLKTRTSYRLYFEITDPEVFENTTVTLDGASLPWRQKPNDSCIYYEISSIPASGILDEFTLTFANGGKTADAAVSVQDYVQSALGMDNNALKNVVIALCDFCRAAGAYFRS